VLLELDPLERGWRVGTQRARPPGRRSQRDGGDDQRDGSAGNRALATFHGASFTVEVTAEAHDSLGAGASIARLLTLVTPNVIGASSRARRRLEPLAFPGNSVTTRRRPVDIFVIRQ
jgi:hypothetical protein